jgi:ribosomal protein S30
MPKLKNKERILKTPREKCQLTYKGKHIRIPQASQHRL